MTYSGESPVNVPIIAAKLLPSAMRCGSLDFTGETLICTFQIHVKKIRGSA
jgi:hypothetical protein